MELMEQIIKHKADDEEILVNLHTIKDEHNFEQQVNFLTQMKANLSLLVSSFHGNLTSVELSMRDILWPIMVGKYYSIAD